MDFKTLKSYSPSPHSLTQAFLKAAQRESNKPAGARIREDATVPLHLLIGVGRGVWHLLGSGISPFLEGTTESIRNLTASEDSRRKNRDTLKGLRSASKALKQDPMAFLQKKWRGVRRALTGKAVQFLQADKAEQARQVGEVAPEIVLFWLTGKFPAKLLGARPLSNGLTLRKFPLGVRSLGEFRTYTDWILKTTQGVLGKATDKTFFTGVRGSSVTGKRFHGGVFRPDSDLDFFVVSDELFLEGRRRGARGRKGMLFVGDTLKYFKKELAPLEKKISAAIKTNPDAGEKRKATIRIFSQKGFEQIAQGPGKEIVDKPGFLFWAQYNFQNFLKRLWE